MGLNQIGYWANSLHSTTYIVRSSAVQFMFILGYIIIAVLKNPKECKLKKIFTVLLSRY